MARPPGTNEPAEIRFWRHIEKTDGCWLWTGTRNGRGYGELFDRGKQVGAHRRAWEIANGPIPPGLCVCHTCDVRHCVRPDHLFLGTQADNHADKLAKGRQARGDGHGNAVLSTDLVLELRARHARGEGTYRQLADEIGHNRWTVYYAITGRRWGHVSP